MLKKDLRIRYKNKRKTLSDDEILLLSHRMFDHFLHFFQPEKGQKIHIFKSIFRLNEVDTEPAIKTFLEMGLRVFVPKMVGNELISVEIQKDSLFRRNVFGIEEPISDIDSGETHFDFIITPLLYCDKKGNRVGYGKGFYDRLFHSVSEKSLRIGFNFFSPEEKIDDVSEEDIPLHYLVTSTEVLSFGGASYIPIK